MRKNIKPIYTVDITSCETIDDVRVAFALAKYNNGVALDRNDIVAIVNHAVDTTLHMIPVAITIECECKPIEKKPWYKRFWNKLKYAFTW